MRSDLSTEVVTRSDPDLAEGEHERMAHIVLEGFTTPEEEFVSAGPSVVESLVNASPVRALCGKTWIPNRDPRRYPVCPTCKEIAEAMGWKVPST